MSEPSAVTSCRFASSTANFALFAPLPLSTWNGSRGGREVRGAHWWHADEGLAVTCRRKRLIWLAHSDKVSLIVACE